MALDTWTSVSAPEAERETLPFLCCTCSPKKRNQVSLCLFFYERSTILSPVGNIVPLTSANSEISRLSAFKLDNHVCQHMAPGVTRWITKDSDCCLAGSLTERSGRTATAVVGDRWASRRKIEGGQVWTITPSKEDWADKKTQTHGCAGGRGGGAGHHRTARLAGSVTSARRQRRWDRWQEAGKAGWWKRSSVLENERVG